MPKDPAEAVKLIGEAVARGDANARDEMGRLYARGDGVTKDPAQAVAWYRKAAAGGDADGYYDLGMAYSSATGIAADAAQAAKWLTLAKAAGTSATDVDAQLAKVTRQLTPSQLADARRQAKAWQATHPQ